jgi:hypothetical protein
MGIHGSLMGIDEGSWGLMMINGNEWGLVMINWVLKR